MPVQAVQGRSVRTVGEDFVRQPNGCGTAHLANPVVCVGCLRGVCLGVGGVSEAKQERGGTPHLAISLRGLLRVIVGVDTQKSGYVVDSVSVVVSQGLKACVGHHSAVRLADVIVLGPLIGAGTYVILVGDLVPVLTCGSRLIEGLCGVEARTRWRLALYGVHRALVITHAQL